MLNDMQRFGERVKEMRLALGLSQEELASRAGMSQQAINKLEAKGNSSKYIIELAHALNVTPEWLKTGKDTPSETFIRFPLSSWGNISTIKDWQEFSIKENYIFLKVEDSDMINRTTMVPTFPPGTIIVINPHAQHKMNDFVIAIHKEKGTVLFRQVVKFGLDIYLAALNSLADPYHIEDFYITGVVVASMFLGISK